MESENLMAVYLVCAIAALAGLLFGFDTGIISGALLFIEQGFTLSTVMKELIVSSVLLGAMAGSLLSGRLTDLYGRRLVILIISGLFIIGTLIASLATSVQFILIGRLCIGFAIGIGSYTAPLYIAEVAQLELRGGLVSLNQLAITIGIMCSYFINYAFTNTQGSWRLMFAIGLIPAVFLAIGMIFLPESPRWLIKQKRHEEARKILRRLRGKHNVAHELNAIENGLSVREAGLKEVFSATIRPVLFLGMMLGFLQQVTGINTIIYYAPTIFQLAGFQDSRSAILATAGIGVVNVIATIFAVLYLDKLGRRTLLLVGLVGMCLSLLSLSLAFQADSHTSYLRGIAVVSTFTYVISFAFSLGAMLWLLISEIFPLSVRGTAMSIAVFSCWFWNFIVSSTFLTLLNALEPTNTFLVYAVMCVIAFIFCYFKIPETKGVSLETIEDNIRRGLPLREIGQPAIPDKIAAKTYSG